MEFYCMIKRRENKMSTKIKRIVSVILVFVISFSIHSTAAAEESTGSGLVLSAGALTLTEGSSAVLTAALQEGFDASRLACVSADPNVATVIPVAAVNHIANFQVNYVGSGTTVVAVYHLDNPAVVAYAAITTSPLIMDIPSRLGTNHDNYCEVTGYTFVPYDMNQYASMNDYKYTMNLEYRCVSYQDDGFSKWGCYGYFYDAAGTVLKKVHLYCSSLSKNRIYKSEFHVPVNAVRFSIEGF